MREKLVVANWKMNGNLAVNKALVSSLIETTAKLTDVNIGICPPSIYLSQVEKLLDGTSLKLGAQDISAAESGAYTGEIAASMLKEFGCSQVIVGHSERRQYHGETDDVVAKKFVAAKTADLTPIFCVGETLEERESEKTLEVIQRQVAAVLSLVSSSGIDGAVIAYEPVWAIGTGLTATPDQAQEVHKYIRSLLGDAADRVSILYGGSVKASNAAELFAMPDIDGALVGGASLKADEFTAICQAANSLKG